MDRSQRPARAARVLNLAGSAGAGVLPATLFLPGHTAQEPPRSTSLSNWLAAVSSGSQTGPNGGA